jgi:hypothetical protein
LALFTASRCGAFYFQNREVEMARMPMVPEDYLNSDSADARVQGDIGDPDLTGLSVTPRLESNASSVSGPKYPIGPVQGYPEDGKHAWRTANDDAIVAAVGRYNSANGYSPRDAEYMTPQLMKSWMMRESGGTPEAFGRDPFQMNNAGDWDPRKADVAGLSKGQAMTPQASADAALKWLQCKGTQHDANGKPIRYRGHYEAFRLYNGSKRDIHGVPADVDYANAVMNNARISYGAGQH